MANTPNPFDQFDSLPAQPLLPKSASNPFDQFDSLPTQPIAPTPPQSEPPKATFFDSVGKGYDSVMAG